MGIFCGIVEDGMVIVVDGIVICIIMKIMEEVVEMNGGLMNFDFLIWVMVIIIIIMDGIILVVMVVVVMVVVVIMGEEVIGIILCFLKDVVGLMIN